MNLTNEVFVRIQKYFSWMILFGCILIVLLFFLEKEAELMKFIFRLYHLFRVFCFYTFHMKYNIVKPNPLILPQHLMIFHLRHREAFSVYWG